LGKERLTWIKTDTITAKEGTTLPYEEQMPQLKYSRKRELILIFGKERPNIEKDTIQYVTRKVQQLPLKL